MSNALPPKSPAIEHVLQAVRKTGMGAHPMNGEPYSDLVFGVAILRGLNPVELQAEVDAWADARDKA